MTDKVCFHRNAENVASHRCEVVEHRWVNDRYKYLRLSAQSDLAALTRPGQFYQLKCPVTDEQQPFLLRPMSVYGTGPEPDTIEFLYNVTGVGTRALATLAEGATLDIVGSLGNTFSLDTANLLRNDAGLTAIIYVATSLAGGLAFAAAGVALARRLRAR